MAQTTDTDLTTEADVIANETVAGANTKTRVATMVKNVIDSKINNDKIDTANTLDTASRTVAGRDAVKAYADAISSNLSSHTSNTNNPHTVTKTQVGLSNVDNTSDVSKPVSTATQSALDLKLAADVLDTAATLDTALKTVPGRDAVKSYIETQVTTTTTVSVSGATSLDATAYGKLHVLSGTSYTVDLPTAVGNAGKTIAFKGLVGLTGTVTIDGLTTETIDGETTRAIGSRGVMVLQSDGTNWIVVHEVGSWIAWTPTFTGFSADPTNVEAKYFRTGNRIETRVSMSGGTSNATTFTMTMPFQSLLAYNKALVLFNAGSAVLGNGRLAAGSNVLTMFTAGSTAFTASGVKQVSWSDLSYEKA